ncbi:MAG: DUF3575 domain-containing protein [Alistipes sp.]
MTKKTLLSLILALSCYLGASAQQIAVKTNLLYWATTTPNLGVEFALSNHSTVSISANYNPWTIGEDAKIQHWFIQPEYRYWLSEKFTRSFFGAHLIGGQFEIGGFKLPFNLLPNFATHHYKGSAIGGGISYGYHFYISPHWSLEAVVGVGYARLRYHRTDFPANKISRNYFGPTQAGISMVYLFNSKK